MALEEKFLAPCGLYCGVCGVLYATRDNNEKFLQKLLSVYQSKIPGLDDLTAEDLKCDGCLSDRKSIFCQACAIRDCTQEKDYQGCHEYKDWPCEHIEHFPIQVGKKVILRAIPHWRKHGTEKWVEEEEARYICPECSNRIFRGAKRCNKCKTSLDLD